MNKLLVCISLLLTLVALPTIAQNDAQTLYSLARQAKDNGENKKAIGYFEDLLKKTNADAYYQELFDLYNLEKQFDDNEKLTKKRIKKFPNRGELLVNRGYLAELQNKQKEADKYYEDALDHIDKTGRQTRIIAFQFNRYKLYEYVEKTYQKSRKLQRDDNLYRFEMANALAQQGKTSDVVEEYLSAVGKNRSYLQTVQNLLQRIINPDPEGVQRSRLKDQLLRKIQQNPSQEVFSELLVWLFIQDKNFNGAFIQCKALDKKLSEDGQRVFSLGQLCLSNEEYTVAEKSFKYVIDLGPGKPYYFQSKMRLVDVLKEKITSGNKYTQEDLLNLKSAYERTIVDLGRNNVSSPMLRGLAELNAYYLNDVPKGIKILNEVIELPGLKRQTKAKTKIELADLYLLNDEVWEASLLYSQVEKEFKYDQLGEIAKLKNAKIAYYVGDFFWAQAQLDVLKGSTSKLISNDAMDLSLLITDNVGRDSIVEPLQMYAVADLMIFRKRYDYANKIMDSIPKYFPSTTLKDDILFTKYKIEFDRRNYEAAASNLKELISNYGDDILGDDALFALAKLEEEQFDNKEKAMELYKSLLTTYPSSLYVIEARKRFRFLRGDKLDEEIN